MATAKLSASKPATPAKPTRAAFEKFLELRERRLALNREADALDKEEKALAAPIRAYAIFAGGKTRTVECCGHRASITETAGSPYWLHEFTRLAGQAEVERLRREANPRQSLKVEKL